MSDTPVRLYHYTSVETLLLILENKTLRFNNLTAVDDPEEAEAKDVYLPGRFCYVSCWTDDPAESIPMWSMYGGSKLDGVRLELPTYPFKKYVFPAGAVNNKERLESFINLAQRTKDNYPPISADMPVLIEVDYTNREELIHPVVKNESKTDKSIKIEVNFEYIGVFKRKVWAFQNEWRYKLMVGPYLPSELAAVSSYEDHFRFMKRLEDPEYQPVESFIDLELSGDALSRAVILLGPNISAADEGRIRTTAAVCNPGIAIERSRIRFRS